jgi:hypothetical protein
VNGANAYENGTAFDTDPGTIGPNNSCTTCISHHIVDFEGQVHNSHLYIRDLVGQARTANVKTGTTSIHKGIRWGKQELQMSKQEPLNGNG